MLGNYDRFERTDVICITLGNGPRKIHIVSACADAMRRRREAFLPRCGCETRQRTSVPIKSDAFSLREPVSTPLENALDCPAMSRAAKSHLPDQSRSPPHLAARPAARPPAPFGEGPPATAAAVEHLGYVQIDTINVIERCHHHILWSRIPAYRRADLRQAQSVDKSVFEYWTHALSYVPAKDLRFFIPAMKRHRREGHKWLSSVKPADVRKVMRLIRRDGALTIRDIDDDVLVDKEHLWASRKPSKRALQLAFYQGVAHDQRTHRHAQDL